MKAIFTQDAETECLPGEPVFEVTRHRCARGQGSIRLACTSST